MSNVPTNLIPTRITGLPEYTGTSTLGYIPYILDGRTYKVQFGQIAAVGAVPSTRVIAAGTGLTGGGDLSENRVISIAPGGVGFDQLAVSGATAGTYGNSGNIPVVTVDSKGRVTNVETVPLVANGYVPTSRLVSAGVGLLGGGSLTDNITLSVNFYASAPQALGSATPGVSNAAARGDHVHPAVDLSDANQTQGALPLGRGGTGDALSPVAGAVVYSTGTKFALADPGIPGQVLTSAGTGEPYWQTIEGTGTVTSVAVLTGNGFAGTVNNPNTVAEITLSTTVTGLVKGNGTALSAAVAGTDYVAPGAITGSGLTMATDRLLGRTTALTGAVEQITVGSGLSLSAGVLSSTVGGTVTSVAASGGSTGLTFSGSPITTSGTLTLGGTLAVASGGTGATTAAGARTNLGAAASGANSDITSLSGITGSISTVDSITFDTATNTTPVAGQTGWNIDFGTTTRGLGNGTIILDGMDLVAYCANAEATTLARGEVVYISGSTGSRATVRRAANTSDNTSAMTIGFVKDPIAAGASGYIVTQGVVDKLNLGAYASGDIIYLGATPGTFTNVQPYAPNHVVVLGVVERANAGNGQIYVKVNNGWELNELHNVSAQTPSNGQVIIYNASTSLWQAANLTAGTNVSITNGPGSITINASDQFTGTVTSVAASGGTTGLTFSGSPITTSGTLTLGGTLAIANGGTGATTAADARTNLGLGTAAVLNAGVANGVATLDGAGTVPTSQLPAAVLGALNYQGVWNASTNTPTLTSSVGTKGYYYVVDVAGSTNLNGITDWKIGDWAVYNGTVWQKIDNTDSVTSVNGYTGAVVLSYTDVGAPSATGTGASGTWGINVTGTAANVTGTVAVANGGTGQTSYTNGQLLIGNSTGNTLTKATLTAGSGVSITNGNGSITIAATGSGGTVTSVDVSGGTTGLTTSGGPITASGTITLAGTLAVSNGGTGATSLSSGYLLKGNGTSAVSASVVYDNGTNVGIGTTSPSQLLDVNGTVKAGTSGGVSLLMADNSAIRNLATAGNTMYFDSGVGTGSTGGDFQFRATGSYTTRLYINGNTGNVGIGTTSASERLTVQGNQIIIPAAGWSSGQTSYLFLGDGNNGVLNTNGGYQTYFAFNGHSWNVNSSEAMRIDGSRNVGIGTSTPGYRLDVSGVINTNAAVRMTPTNVGAFTRAQLQSAYNLDGTGASVFTWNYTNGGGELDLFINRNGGGTGGLKIYDFPNTSGDPTNIFTVEGGGNVGIGTASPATSLSVVTNTTSHIGMRVTNNSTTQFAGSGLQMLGPSAAGTQGGAAIYYYNTTVGGTQGGMAMAQLANNGSFQRNIAYYDFNGQSWGFATNSTERMRIDSSGNVGIGTSVPGATLDVAGTIRTSAGGSDPGTGTVLYFVGSGSFQSVIAGAAFAVHTGNNFARTERMRVDISGNVGIGTSSPGAKLQINAQDGFRFDVETGAASTMRFGSASTGEATAALAFTRTTGVISLSSGSTGSALNERMRIDGSGNVAIGTTTTASRLRVAAGAQINAPVLGNVTNYPAFLSGPDTGFGLGIGTNNADGRTWLQSQRSDGGTATYPITLNEAGGNVGIGTSAPGSKLTVVGGAVQQYKASGDNNAFYGSTSDTSNNYLRLQNSVNTVDVTCSNGSAYLNSAQSVLWFGNNGVERMRLSGSELLIGTTSGGRSLCLFGSDVWQRIQNASRSWLIGMGTTSTFYIWDETGGGPRFWVDTSGSINAPNSFFLGSGANNDNKIEIGAGRTGNNYAYIDLIGDTTYTDYGLRLLRGNTGPNTGSELAHRGTGDLNITCYEAATMRLNVNGGTRMYIDSAGTSLFTGLIVGRTGLGSDVNSANDTGSFSVRGDTTKAASISFHRAGAYAMNMGLGTDAVFRIGGWSAVSNAFQMDGSGNLTMAGNVTAYSDARLKKDVETIDSALDLVSKMRGVRYTRIDSGKRGVGVIAQEMLEVLPEVVQQGVGDDDTLSVAYGNLVGVLIEAVKELTARVAELEGK